jgi:hypothetical protein
MRRHTVPLLFFGYDGSRTIPENPQRITVDADGLPTGLRGPHRSHVQDSRQLYIPHTTHSQFRYRDTVHTSPVAAPNIRIADSETPADIFPNENHTRA